jgi:succinoglycan biosynthesis transport protein ExoP
MLQRTEQARGLPYDNGVAPRHFDLVDLYAFLKSNRRVLAGWVIVTLTVALVYAFTATPLYTATADLTIDSKKIQLFKNNEQVVGDNTMDSSQVESEVQVLGSENIALAVIDDLKLANDPEFIGTGNGPLVGLLSAIFGMDDDARSLSDLQRKRIAIKVLRDNLSVRRIGLSYVLEISYRSPDPAKAAQIANAVADAYINDQLNTKYQAARRASIWLQERIAELRNQSNVAARAVQDYKEKNNIVDTGNHGLLSDLQVQETNTQMIAAQAATAEAKARLDRIEEVLKSPAPGEALGTVTDTLKNEVINKLRQRYLDDTEHVAKFTAMMGANHLAVVNLKNEMALLQASMVDELQRIAQTYKSDYEIAKAREESTRASLGKQIQEAGASGQAQVDLKELEAASQTYHTIFENFLQKYTEAVQQQSFPISDARVITPASRPNFKSYPKTTLIALLGLLVGIGAGLLNALVLRNFDRAIRRPRDVEERLGLECLGMVPFIATRQRKTTSHGPKLLQAVERLMTVPVKDSPPEADLDLTRKVLDDPFSHFSEGLRSIKTGLDILALTRPIKTLGVISATPGEGKSTIAVNLANLFAAGGRSTLLIDGDLRNPQLSRLLSPDAKGGLVELIAGKIAFTKAMRAIPQSTLRFIPTVLQQRIANTADLLASPQMRTVLGEVQNVFDQVVIDLPPLGPISDARAMSPLIDAFIVVANWGHTRFEVLEDAIANFGIAADKVVGVILNKVDYNELRNMDAYSHGYYHNKNYAKYGYAYSQD